ncbi:MAG: hypothetical protein ABI775_01970 [Pseudonocardiales bacterium]
MTDSNVDRIRYAVLRVEGLLSELDGSVPVEVWTEPPPEPVGASRPAELDDRPRSPAASGEADPLRARAEAAALRVAAAADVAQTLAVARQVADRLLEDERREAEALVAAAELVAQDLHAEKRKTAAAMVNSAREVAEQLQDQDRQVAHAMVAEARDVAEELHAEKQRTAAAMVSEAQDAAQLDGPASAP